MVRLPGQDAIVCKPEIKTGGSTSLSSYVEQQAGGSLDRIDLFRIFTQVVECSSFTRAANLLGMPRSTVSAAVAELEQRVGTRLLHRSTRKVPAPVTLVYSHRQHVSRRLQVFLDWLQPLLKDKLLLS